MSNTEIREALDRIREAESQVTAALQQPGLTQSQRDLLFDLAEMLRDMDNRQVLEELKADTAAFERKANQMVALSNEAQEQLKDLQQLAETVELVAKAVNGLVKAFKIVA